VIYSLRAMNRAFPIGSLLLAGYLAGSYFFRETLVRNKAEIVGPLDAVFDLITTARYWPELHPATLEVKGSIYHPVLLGETIEERVNIFGVPGTVTWTVVERRRPHGLTLRGRSRRGGRAEIHYDFSANGGRVTFTRTLRYAFLGLAGPLDWLWVKPIMERQSAIATRNLKALVERLVSAQGSL